MVRAIILSGGWGTRLRPLTCTIPKTLIPIVNKPVIERQILLLKKAGVKEVILAVSVMSEVIQNYFEDGSKLGLKIRYTDEKFPAGTAGAVKLAEEYLLDDNFFMLNGDVILNFDFSKMFRFHNQKKGIGTIASKIVEDPSRYGVLITNNKSNKIERFLEKENYNPLVGGVNGMPINAGVYLLEPEIFSYITANKKVSIEREVFPKLASEGSLYHYPIEGIWKDVGKPHELLSGNIMLMKDLLRTEKKLISNNLKLHKSSKIIQPCAIADHVKIGEECIIGPNVIIGKNVNIKRNTEIKDTIIYNNSYVSENVKIERSIIADNCVIGKKVTLKGQDENLIILSSHVKVMDNTQLVDPEYNSYTVCHHEIISENSK